MPELPEVETIVRGLNKKAVGLKIVGAWTDWAKTIKTHKLTDFVHEIKGRKILRARRRAKYIMIDLSGGKTLIIHQKISGHLLYGKWIKQSQISNLKSQNYNSKFKTKLETGDQKWVSTISGPLQDDPYNRFIRFIIFLSNGYMLGLSDVRRFGKIFLGDTDKIENINEIGKLGPEPLDPKFTLAKFKELMRHKRGVIKKVLMDPFVIAGIGNIYSDEILWYAGVAPLRRVEKLTDKELATIYKYIKFVLKKAIGAKGDSQQDYRTLEGKFGNYQNMQKAYQLTGEKCQKHDGGIIKRIVINSRSAHFCPVHQK
ncbi:MAG: bifunctional DNA-formamidopyrimidine glycosylase/DNA-(apurinic or apyrimidinic site) lyase [Candidatus Yanofskybacteria bacterium]|nr:bifunctional DNA-formamidopyrimidine glycosylase/DNA-(apurinic or apyrimidinic site) lyase [Candidatus Yanofskybacteria bacterium]